MLRNVLIAITSAVLLGAISLFAAEKVKEKKAAEREQPKQTFEQQRPGMLLDELIAAYKANDREKMGQVIRKMEQRREKMQKFARFERWHRWAHRRMEMKESGWHRDGGPAQREAQRSPGWGCCGKDGWGPPAREYRQMPGFDRGERPWREGFDGRGRGDWTPGPGQRFGPEFNPERQRMPGFNPYGGERPMPPRDNPSPDSEW